VGLGLAQLTANQLWVRIHQSKIIIFLTGLDQGDAPQFPYVLKDLLIIFLTREHFLQTWT
jgi:hypothetical protein